MCIHISYDQTTLNAPDLVTYRKPSRFILALEYQVL